MSTDGPILITGVAGFIGSHLARRLVSNGLNVAGIDNFDAFYARDLKQANLTLIEQVAAPGRFSFQEGDICDAAAMRVMMSRLRPSVVVHIAALAGVRPSIQSPARYAEVNIRGLVNVMEAMRHADCLRLVFASSSSVYGNNAKASFSETDSVDEPISPYAATKRAGEMLCDTWARLWGFRIAVLRFFTVYGPAQRPDLAIGSFMRRIAAGEPVSMFGDGSTSRDYTYIDDIIDGVTAAIDLVRAGDSRDAGWFRILNLGNSNPVTLAAMIDSIASVVGKPACIERLPMQTGDVQRTFADITRAATELKFHPRVPFDEGLRRQWEWMSKQLNPA